MHALGRQVFSLAAGQFFIEYYEQPYDPDPRKYASVRVLTTLYLFIYSTPATSSCHISLSPSPLPMRKTRSRAKPTELFIHPNNSNLARADAAAVERGLHGSTERVSVGAARTSSDSDDDHERTWERDRGRDAARALLGGAQQQVHTSVRTHAKSDSQQMLFQVGGSDSESED